MRRSLSWIDPQELSVALVRAGVRREPRRQARPENVDLARLRSAPGLGARREDSRESAPRSDPRPSPPPSQRPLGAAARSGERPSFRPPPGILETRLKAFFSWAIELSGSRSLFLTDAEGLVLMETGASSEMIDVTSSFTSLLDRMRSALGSEPQGVVAIDLDPRRILHLVRVDSGLGAHTFGLVTGPPMPRDLIEELRQALAGLLAAEEVEELFGT